MSTLVLWEVKLKPETSAKAQQLVLELLPGTRTFAGCRSIEPYRNQSDPHHLMLIQHWDSFEHYKKYAQWRSETGVLPEFLTLCASAPVLQSFDLVS